MLKRAIEFLNYLGVFIITLPILLTLAATMAAIHIIFLVVGITQFLIEKGKKWTKWLRNFIGGLIVNILQLMRWP